MFSNQVNVLHATVLAGELRSSPGLGWVDEFDLLGAIELVPSSGGGWPVHWVMYHLRQ